jgi:hypothetical protein
MNITIVKGQIKYPAAKVLNTTHGPRVNAVVVLENSQEIKIWGNPDDEIAKCHKGDFIELIQTQNGGWKMLSKAEQMEPEPLSVENPEIEKLANKLCGCFEAIKMRQPKLSEETVRTMAISLFIQLGKG